MAEELRTEQKGFKVWKTPQVMREPLVYLGEFYPPEGQSSLTAKDLRQLGLGPGRYTLLAPPNAAKLGQLTKWQSVVTPE